MAKGNGTRKFRYAKSRPKAIKPGRRKGKKYSPKRPRAWKPGPRKRKSKGIDMTEWGEKEIDGIIEDYVVIDCVLVREAISKPGTLVRIPGTPYFIKWEDEEEDLSIFVYTPEGEYYLMARIGEAVKECSHRT